MNSNNLLDAIGEVKDEYVLSAVQSREGRAAKQLSFRKPLLMAAVIAMLLMLVGCGAVIYSRIQMKLVDNPQPEETVMSQVEGQPAKTIEEILLTYYPQTLPEGYSCVSGYSEGVALRNIIYQNDAGTEIIYAMTASQDFNEIPLTPPVEVKTVEIAGQTATLRTTEAGVQSLVWEIAETGIQANLETEDPGVDLLAMAESVAPGEPMEPNFYYKDGALWDVWYPQQMPEGYVCSRVSSMSNGSQDIEYINDGVEENGYIQYVVSAEMDLSDIGEAPHSTMVWENVDIDGTPGRMVSIGDYQWLLFWKNESEGVNFMLNTEDPNVDLVEIAKSVGPGPKLETTPIYTPGFTLELEQSEGYVAYEAWYPQWLPEGYEESFVSDKAYGEQLIRYKNAEGDEILYNFYFRLGQWGRSFDSSEEPEQVDINGHVGYRTAHGIIWTDEERGFAFMITGSPDADLLKMARSVAVGPERPSTFADKTTAALETQGDYQITQLPEGMFEDGLTGMPLEDGSDWYGYVRRWYFSKESNAEIYFEYETYISDELGTPQEMCRRTFPDDGRPVTEVEIAGCPGAYHQEGDTAEVAWATLDGNRGIRFYMTSDHFTAEELVEIAQSVKKMN